MNSQTKVKESEIERTLTDINKNKNFANSLPFMLTRLKNKLTSANNFTNLESALEMLQKKIVVIFNEIYFKQVNENNQNENLLIKISEILEEIVKILIKDEKNSKNYFFLIFSEHQIQNITVNYINQIHSIKTKKILLQIYNDILLFYFNTTNEANVSEHIDFIQNVIAHNDNDEVIIASLQIQKRFCESTPFSHLISDTAHQNFITDFISKISRIVKETKSPKIALLCVQLFDLFAKFKLFNIEHNQNLLSITFFLDLLSKFSGESSLPFYACKVLSQIISTDEINALLIVLQSQSFKDFAEKCEMINEKDAKKKILNEIKDSVHDSANIAENDEKFAKIKRNITRILLLMSKDAKVIEILKTINTFECFIELLCTDITSYSLLRENESEHADEIALIKNTLPDLIRVVINLVKKCHFDPTDKDNKIVNDFTKSFVQILKLFPGEKGFVQEILAFFLEKEKNKELYLSSLFAYFTDDKDKEKTFVTLLSNYYAEKWIHSFLHRLPISLVYPTIHDSHFLNDIMQLKKEINNIQTMYNDVSHAQMAYLINAISLKLILGITLNKESNVGFDIMFPAQQSIFTDLNDVIMLLINFIINTNPKSAEVYNEKNIAYIITLTFSIVENINFFAGKVKEKCDIIFALLSRLSEMKSLSAENMSHISIRFMRLVEYKLENVMNDIFERDEIVAFTISALTAYSPRKDENSELFIKSVLTIMYQMFKDGNQIAKFIKSGGVNLLLKIIENNAIIDYEITKLLIQNIRVLQIKNFSEVILIYNNPQNLKNLITNVKNVKFCKGINENVYCETAIFVKNVMKSCDVFDICEETNFLQFEIEEYSDIFSFYSDPSNSAIVIVSELISILWQSAKLLLSIVKSKLNEKVLDVNNKILSQFTSKSEINPNLFENIINIEGSYYKTLSNNKTELQMIYANKKESESYKMINSLLVQKDSFAKLSDMSKLFVYIEPLVLYENTIKKSEARIISISFLTSLKDIYNNMISANNKITSSNAITFAEKIDTYIEMITNPSSSSTLMRKTTTEENERMMKDLIAITSDRKNAVRRKTRESLSINDELGSLSSRRRTLSISSNPTLKLYYDKILNNFNSLVKEIPTKFLAKQNVTAELNDLFEVLRLWKYFTKDDENIQKMFLSGILDKLVIIIESDSIFTMQCQEQAFALFEKMTYSEVANEFLMRNANFLAFLFRELNKIMKIFADDVNVEGFAKAKLIIETRILAQLSEEENFIKEYFAKFNKEHLFNIVCNDQCEMNISVNILSLIKNLIKREQSDDFVLGKKKSENEEEEENGDEIANECDLILNVLWSKYKSEINVIKVLIDIISFETKNEKYTSTMLDMKLIEKLCEIIIVGNVDKQKKNSDGFLSVIELFNTLCKYSSAISTIAEITVYPILTALSDNLFNTKIVESSLKLFYTLASSDTSNIAKVCITGTRELTLQIINKYLNTCHINIIEYALKLIFTFIIDEENCSFYSVSGMDTLLKTVKYIIKNEQLISLEFDILNKLTKTDIIIEVERMRRTNSIIGGDTTHDQTLMTSSIRFKSTNNTQGNTISYDFHGLLGIIRDIFSQYQNNYFIIEKLYKLLENLTHITTDKGIHTMIFDVTVNGGNRILNSTEKLGPEEEKHASLFLTTLIKMIENDSIIIRNLFSSALFIITKVPVFSDANSILIKKLIMILKSICDNSNMDEVLKFKVEIKDFSKWIKSQQAKVNNEIIMTYLEWMEWLYVNKIKDLSNEISDDIKFVLSFCNRNPTPSAFPVIIKKCSVMISAFTVKDEDLSEVQTLLTSLYLSSIKQESIEDMKIILNMIINSINTNPKLKDYFKKSEVNLITEYQTYAKENSISDQGCDYLIKSYDMIMKYEDNQRSNTRSSKSNVSICSKSGVVEASDMKKFLTTETEVLYYLENGESKKCLIKMDKDLKVIYAYDKKSHQVIDSMSLSEMDMCVRNCSTPSFTKKKWHIFSHKPKPQMCFSIYATAKEIDKPVKTFNIECYNEDTCLSYVNHISNLINIYK